MENAIAQTWLSLQCQMIPDVVAGVVIYPDSTPAAHKISANWPDEQSQNDALIDAAHLAKSRLAPVVSAKSNDALREHHNGIIAAQPLMNNGELYGVVAIQVLAAKEKQASVLHLLHWGSAWLDLIVTRDIKNHSQSYPLITSTLNTVFQSNDIHEAINNVANDLAQHLACKRVSIGLMKDNGISIQAVSKSAHFEKNSTLITNIVAAMEEAAEFNQTISYPLLHKDTRRRHLAHAQLSSSENNESILTIPMTVDTRAIGAICFENYTTLPFSKAQIKTANEIVELLAQLISLKSRKHRTKSAGIFDLSFINTIKSFFGPARWKYKMMLTLAVVFICLAAFINGNYRISSPANIEGLVQRVIVAPFDGYIASANARAGQTVRSGDILAVLDDQDLKLEGQRLASQRGETVKQYTRALAALDHAQARIFRAQEEQVAAKQSQLEDKLHRTLLRAPIDGVIISGDLNKSLGAPVEKGQVLFEMAPLNDYRVILQVDENDIARITQGQSGQLTLRALPNDPIPLVVEAVNAIYQSDTDKSVYSVEARITGRHDMNASLRPGMQGIGKIDIEPRSYLWIGTHKFVNWLQLRLWAWLP